MTPPRGKPSAVPQDRPKTARRLVDAMGIDLRDQALRKRFIGFGEEDVEALRTLAPLVQSCVHEVIEELHGHLLQFDGTKDILGSTSESVGLLRRTHRQYLIEIFSGAYDEDYFERRLRIGAVHDEIGLSPRWYLGAHGVLAQSLCRRISRRYRLQPLKLARCLQAVQKILSLDQALAIEAYVHSLLGRSAQGLKTERTLALSEQAQAIGDVIAAANDLAEQSSLLAVNAVVDGGEAGQGLSAVAGELKALAESLADGAEAARRILASPEPVGGDGQDRPGEAPVPSDVAGLGSTGRAERAARDLTEPVRGLMAFVPREGHWVRHKRESGR